MMEGSGVVLEGESDHFGGVTVMPSSIPDVTPDRFEILLRDSLHKWQSQSTRGIWIGIPIQKSEFIPLLVKSGFVFHHAKPDYVMMNQWLPKEEPNKLPMAPFTSVGVGGFVLNQKNELLVVKEKFFKNSMWKLPGGMADPGEDIPTTAVREVVEETGIKTEFQSVICVKHNHHGLHDTSNLYFIVRLKPLTEEIHMEASEIAECKWMPIEEFLVNPTLTVFLKELVTHAYSNTNQYKSKEMTYIDVEAWHKKWTDKLYFTDPNNKNF
uniref:Nudix hydrolase domain-containing protein n=1 Tax=Arcella intermedia TaxID=1963864 RepID=A0A6B2LDX1_9EUKA